MRVQLRNAASQTSDASSGSLLKVDGLELDAVNQVAYRDGRTIELSERETRLRRRQVEGKGSPTLIHTVYGKGYRFGSGVEG